jgi:hypothetical protein
MHPRRVNLWELLRREHRLKFMLQCLRPFRFKVQVGRSGTYEVDPPDGTVNICDRMLLGANNSIIATKSSPVFSLPFTLYRFLDLIIHMLSYFQIIQLKDYYCCCHISAELSHLILNRFEDIYKFLHL